jgi:hypothetical protein
MIRSQNGLVTPTPFGIFQDGLQSRHVSIQPRTLRLTKLKAKMLLSCWDPELGTYWVRNRPMQGLSACGWQPGAEYELDCLDHA